VEYPCHPLAPLQAANVPRPQDTGVYDGSIGAFRLWDTVVATETGFETLAICTRQRTVRWRPPGAPPKAPGTATAATRSPLP